MKKIFPGFWNTIFLFITFLSIAAYTIDVMGGIMIQLDYESQFSFLPRIRLFFVPLCLLYILKYRCINIGKTVRSFIILCIYSSIITVIFRGFGGYSLYASIWIPCITYFWGMSLSRNKELLGILPELLFLFLFAIVFFFYWTSSSIIYSQHDVHLNIVYVPLLCMILALYVDNKYARIVLYILMIATLLESGKRAGFIVLSVGLVIHLLFSFIDNRKRNKQLAILIISLVVLIIFQENISSLLGENRTLIRFTDNGTSDLSSGRLDIYKNTINLFLNSPLYQCFLGHGFGAVEVYSSEHISAHNDFLEILFDYGVFGLLLYTSFHLKLISEVRKSYKENKDNRFVFLISYFSFFILSLISQMYNYPYFYILTLTLGYYEGRNIKKNIPTY